MVPISVKLLDDAPPVAARRGRCQPSPPPVPAGGGNAFVTQSLSSAEIQERYRLTCLLRGIIIIKSDFRNCKQNTSQIPNFYVRRWGGFQRPPLAGSCRLGFHAGA